MELAGLTAPEDESRFRALMHNHHYLGAPWKIGQTVWYAAYDGSGAWPALVAFSAAALKCSARDAWVGRRPRDQYGWLHLVANNVRLLLFRCRPNLSYLQRLAIGLSLGRGRPVAPTIRELNRNPRLVLDWLRLSRNTQPRAKSAA